MKNHLLATGIFGFIALSCLVFAFFLVFFFAPGRMMYATFLVLLTGVWTTLSVYHYRKYRQYHTAEKPFIEYDNAEDQ